MNNLISIVCSLIIFLFPYIGRRWFNRSLLSSTVVSMGLLGTFGGIAYGLWIFGVDRIDESIPQLLEGLKTAFLTSIAGMLSSLLVKLCPSFYGIREVQTEKEETTEHQLLQLMDSIRENTQSSAMSLAALSSSLQQFTQKEVQVSTEMLTRTLQDIINHLDNKISDQISNTLTEIHTVLAKQLEQMNSNQELNKNLNEQLKNALTSLQEANKTTEMFLSKSANLNVRQNETFTTQITHFGDFVKTTGEQFQGQLNKMEEKYERELSEMEKFTNTLMLIIKKLSQDHQTLHKSSDSSNESFKHEKE